ncbi:hypothetical protein PY093_14555 [Cytobacillus sp. S13-E01]|uniref:hypothetical protein n=1 Tax=Cytobacillus sp. S13-E01 TaxID=3031326 RepID=UPI0023D8B073|nr:hypothetical protein [Cytobacillus sp. S13-E01]MDF0727895.1 hypothetical protein [Cytobacillus sp. S13-E01]
MILTFIIATILVYSLLMFYVVKKVNHAHTDKSSIQSKRLRSNKTALWEAEATR